MVHMPAKCANLNLESLSLCLSLSNHRMNLRAHLYLSLSLSSVRNNRSALLLPLVLLTPEKPVSCTVTYPVFFPSVTESTKKKRVLFQTRVKKKKKKKKVLKQAFSSGIPDRQCRHENGIAWSASTPLSGENPPIDRKTHHWTALHPSKSKLAEQTCSLTRATTRKEPLVWPGKRSYGFSSTLCLFLVLAPSPLAPPNH